MDLSDESMVDFDEISTSQSEEPDLVYCSQCGKIIGTTASYFDYQENPLCDKCMVNDSYGTICPSCGRKYPHENIMDNFCQSCYQEQLN